MNRPRLSLLLLALTGMLPGCAKDVERESQSRLAVRWLIKAPASRVDGALQRVVKVGEYALPDIEQEMHSAPQAGRARLLRALERIGSPRALPFVRFLSHWDTDDAVRRQAKVLVATLRRGKK